MRLNLAPVLVVLYLTITPVPASSQTTDPTITFTMPINLTNIPSDIAKVAIYCRIDSGVIINKNNRVEAQVEFLVRGGQVVDNAFQIITSATVPIVVTNLQSGAAGQPAKYECSLTGFSSSLQRWDVFQDSHSVPAFRLTPTPQPLTGSFVW